jgi:small subunit ribosomal protein S20
MINKSNLSRYKTEVKKFEHLIEEKNVEVARAALPSIVATIDQAASKKAISKNSASRVKSSLSRRLNSLAQPTAP